MAQNNWRPKKVKVEVPTIGYNQFNIINLKVGKQTHPKFWKKWFKIPKTWIFPAFEGISPIEPPPLEGFLFNIFTSLQDPSTPTPHPLPRSTSGVQRGTLWASKESEESSVMLSSNVEAKTLEFLTCLTVRSRPTSSWWVVTSVWTFCPRGFQFFVAWERWKRCLPQILVHVHLTSSYNSSRFLGRNCMWGTVCRLLGCRIWKWKAKNTTTQVLIRMCMSSN